MPRRLTVRTDQPYYSNDNIQRIRFDVEGHVPANKVYTDGHTASMDFQMNRIAKWLEITSLEVSPMKDGREMRRVVSVTIDHAEAVQLRDFLNTMLAHEVTA